MKIQLIKHVNFLNGGWEAVKQRMGVIGYFSFDLESLTFG